MLSFKTIFGYLAYAIGATALFLYLLFPEQTVRDYLDGRLKSVDPLLGLGVETMRPTLPPGVTLTGVDIQQDGTRMVRFDAIRITADMMSLMKAAKMVRFDARLADGTISGRASLADIAAGEMTPLAADLSEIRLEQIDLLKRIDRLSLSGRLKGRMTWEVAGSPTEMTNGLVAVTGLQIKLKDPFVGISDIRMTQTEGEFTISGQSLRIKALTFDGPMAEGRITGAIDLRFPLDQSHLNLTGTVKPRPELFARLQETLPQGLVNPRTVGTRGMAFRIRGTLASPDLSTR